MILVDLDKSSQNITKSPHIARKMCHNMGSKIVFFLLHQKRHLSQGKPSKKNLCNTTRQGLSESPSYDLT
jgi:hypothetical protein